MEISPETHRSRWWALIVLLLPVLIISMDATVLGFAAPALSESLEPSSSQLLWIIDIYSFVLAALLVTMGVLGDRVGRRSLDHRCRRIQCSVAPRRFLDESGDAHRGRGAARRRRSDPHAIDPLVDPQHLPGRGGERQTAIALWATAFAVGAAIGPIVGGVLLEHYWWGSVFIIGVPFTVSLVLLAPAARPGIEGPEPRSLRPGQRCVVDEHDLAGGLCDQDVR